MRKFLKLIILFSIPVLIGLTLIEITLRRIPNDYSYKRGYLDKESNNIEVLFLGNSHIYRGVNPEYISAKSFNGAHVSQSLNYDLAILNKYDGRWRKLKYVFISIDYFSLYSSLEDGIESWRVKNYSIYYGIKNNNLQNNFEIFNGKQAHNLSRLKSYLLHNKGDITCNRYGFGALYKSKENKNLKTTGEIAAKLHTRSMVNNLSYAKNYQIIKSIIDFSKTNNIKIIFITSPVYKTYRENLDPKQLNNTVNKIKKIVAINKNTYYYNFMSDRTFVAKDFYNADHLNEKGAKKLTLKIDSLLLKF